MFRRYVFIMMLLSVVNLSQSQDSIPSVDSLRIINLNSYFTHHIDSVYVYQFQINKDQRDYFWFLKNAPVGLTINKDNGVLNFKVAKNYFLSGKLRYDHPYKVDMGVQSLNSSSDKLDTSFTILFYNTEIIPSKLKLSVSGTVVIEEADTLSFRLQCEKGSFPFETIVFNSSIPIKDYTFKGLCNTDFTWLPSFDFTKDSDSAKTRIVFLSFIAGTRFGMKDTSVIRIAVKDALNYSLATESFRQVQKNIRTYVLQLKYAFVELDKKIKRVKRWRTIFDLSSATAALTGTILNTSADQKAQRTGKILPSVGLALTPIKEATTPTKVVEQNQAASVRNSIKRLEYVAQDNEIVGDRDPDILRKTSRLRDELKQVQLQLIDIPLVLETGMTEQELDDYFNSPKVNKKYRLKRK